MINEFKRRLAMPLILLLVLAVIYISWDMFNMPSEEEMVLMVNGYIDTYGYFVVLVAAFLEAALLLGWYFPGGMVIFLGIIFVGDSVWEASLVILMSIIGLSTGYLLNFLLGKYGWYKLLLRFGLKKSVDRGQSYVEKYGAAGIFMSYFHPGFATVTSTCAGILQYSFSKFFTLSAIATMVWSAIWGIMVFILGKKALAIVGLKFQYVFIIIAIWIVMIAVWLLFKKYLNNGGNSELT